VFRPRAPVFKTDQEGEEGEEEEEEEEVVIWRRRRRRRGVFWETAGRQPKACTRMKTMKRANGALFEDKSTEEVAPKAPQAPPDAKPGDPAVVYFPVGDGFDIHELTDMTCESLLSRPTASAGKAPNSIEEWPMPDGKVVLRVNVENEQKDEDGTVTRKYSRMLQLLRKYQS